MLWLDFKMDFTIKNIYIKYLIYYGLLILTVGMISTDKKKAVFYTFNVLLIANVVNYLTMYTKLWYWYNNEIFNFLIPIITFILYHKADFIRNLTKKVNPLDFIDDTINNYFRYSFCVL